MNRLFYSRFFFFSKFIDTESKIMLLLWKLKYELYYWIELVRIQLMLDVMLHGSLYARSFVIVFHITKWNTLLRLMEESHCFIGLGMKRCGRELLAWMTGFSSLSRFGGLITWTEPMEIEFSWSQTKLIYGQLYVNDGSYIMRWTTNMWLVFASI